ncbi:MAG: polysaccharide deacetylase family protein [Thermaceae bacterium]|nr:polysaccharide deacetylase family protein [Thermaceae bacterium]
MPGFLPALLTAAALSAPSSASWLHTLELPALPHSEITYASNGYIEVAQVLAKLPGNPDWLLQAQRMVKAIYRARPGLAEVDLSLYKASEYQGSDPAAPLPRFTASVPKSRLEAFVHLSPLNLASYDRAWLYAAKEPAVPALPVKASRGHLIYRGEASSKYVAFTFDDMPHPLYTPLLLDLLRREGVRATFFVIGRNALAYPYFVRDMVAQGNQVGNHSYDHRRFITLSEAGVQAEVLRTNAILQSLTGQPVQLVRPPGGRLDPAISRQLRDLGLDVVFWTDDPGDYLRFRPKVLETRLEVRFKPGAIVLLHDNVPETLVTLPEFFRYVRARGFIPGTLSDLVSGPSAPKP